MMREAIQVKRNKFSTLLLTAALLSLVGCGASPEPKPVVEARVPITSASELKVHIDDFAFLLDGLRDLGLDCGKFDQMDAWIKDDHEFALCYYKDWEMGLHRWYEDVNAERDITSGTFQPWCQPYVTSHNWAITVWDAQIIKEFASFLDTTAQQYKTSGNSKNCLL